MSTRTDVRAALVAVDKIVFHPHNVRRDLGDLRPLARSIGRYGLLQPVSVEVYGDRYRLRAGHRRTAAARLAGLQRIPAVIYPLPLDDLDWLVQSVHENEQRRGLDKQERRRAVLALRDLGCSWSGIAEHFDVSEGTARQWGSRPGDPTPDQERIEGLAEKVADLTRQGRSASQIADQIGVSGRTVVRLRNGRLAGRGASIVSVRRVRDALDQYRSRPQATAADVIAAIDAVLGGDAA